MFIVGNKKKERFLNYSLYKYTKLAWVFFLLYITLYKSTTRSIKSDLKTHQSLNKCNSTLMLLELLCNSIL